VPLLNLVVFVVYFVHSDSLVVANFSKAKPVN